jgi:hypothetical protein
MAILDLIASAQAALADDPDGILTLKRRADLWAALAAMSDARTGHVRRVHLNAACVRHVLDRWRDRFSEDDGVERMLGLASAVVAGRIDSGLAIEQRDRFYVDVVETRKYDDNPSAMFVGLAAANTVIEALIEDNADAIPATSHDEDMDPETYDPSYMCACAAAGGLNGRSANIEARRRFWAWYLSQAIPEIYAVADPVSGGPCG